MRSSQGTHTYDFLKDILSIADLPTDGGDSIVKMEGK